MDADRMDDLYEVIGNVVAMAEWEEKSRNGQWFQLLHHFDLCNAVCII